MSTIYSAGQYDDAFSPKRLGNWEASAKNVYPSFDSRQFYPGPGGATQVIADEKGHLLPGIPRNKSTAWGLLHYYMRNKNISNIAVLSGPGKSQPRQESKLSDPSSTSEKRMKKLPRFIQKKPKNRLPEDHLLDYLKELRLPIVWIIGPAAKGIFNKRKQFSRQLAKSLRFGYVNLDEKIQEWKDRQSTCTCSAQQLKRKPGSTASVTCIAPFKLPTDVPPRLSLNLPSSKPNSAAPSVSELLDTQRINFDAALPIERNKILELYKFAMAECLPCDGFVCDSVPFDLVEGLAFEKSFYPAALAIYFAESVPMKKSKDHLNVNASGSSTKLLGPMEYLERCKKAKAGERLAFVRTKSHRRLGSFSIPEAEKICRQFGSKTIRIINADEVERDTMEFLNELVKKNLEKYQQILNGDATLDCSVAGCGRHYFRLPSTSPLTSAQENGNLPVSAVPTHYSYSSSFIPEGQEEDDYETCKSAAMSKSKPGLERSAAAAAPKLVSGKSSQTSISMFTFPSIFKTSRHSSPPLSPPTLMEEEEQEKGDLCYIDEDGAAGDPPPICNVSSISRKHSSELLDKITKLESKVAELNPEESSFPDIATEKDTSSYRSKGSFKTRKSEHLPPPTAYAEEDEVETLTSVIRRAIARQNMATANQQRQLQKSQNDEEDYDYGAAGDFTTVNQNSVQRPKREVDKPENADPSDDIFYFEEQFSLLETGLNRKERTRHEIPSSEDPCFDN